MTMNMLGNKTIRVTISDHVMMFGNSNKPREMQYDEYVWMCKRNAHQFSWLIVSLLIQNGFRGAG